MITERKNDGSYELSGKSIAIGEIMYPATGQKEKRIGKLIYIKASLSSWNKYLPVHVRNYHKGHPDFPHQTTADQFFDDAQFEAYRALGEHIGEQAIKKMKKEKIV